MIDENLWGLFITDTYRVLSIMNEPRYATYSYISITQQELASRIECNIMKINGIIKQLIKDEFLEAVKGHRGRYRLTEKAKKLIEKIEK